MLDPQDVIDWARGQNSTVALASYAIANTLLTSILPLPLGVLMMIVGGVLWGQVVGLSVYLATSTLGAWITFTIVRLLKFRVMSMLGKHATTWKRLDEAIMREGLWICFLWRVAPIAPYVISSAMISMTEITQWDYMWTTALGIIPSSFPIVSGRCALPSMRTYAGSCLLACVRTSYRIGALPRNFRTRLTGSWVHIRSSVYVCAYIRAGAAMAGTYLIEKKEMDPLTLTINVLSIGAGIYVMIRLGAIAVEVMAKSGARDDDVPVNPETLRSPQKQQETKEKPVGESSGVSRACAACLPRQAQRAPTSVELV